MFRVIEEVNEVVLLTEFIEMFFEITAVIGLDPDSGKWSYSNELVEEIAAVAFLNYHTLRVGLPINRLDLLLRQQLRHRHFQQSGCLQQNVGPGAAVHIEHALGGQRAALPDVAQAASMIGAGVEGVGGEVKISFRIWGR